MSWTGIRVLLAVKLPTSSCPLPPPVALQMQGLRSHSRTFSRRKLDFGESRLCHAAPLQKRLRKTGHAVLKETRGAECGTHSDDSLSFKREKKQGIGPSKLAATYRRRRSKKVQDDNKHGIASESVLDGVSGIWKGSFKQSCKAVDVSHISENGLPLVPEQKEVSGTANGYSKQSSEDVDGTHHAQSNGELNVAIYSANLRALNEDRAKPSTSDLDMDTGTQNFMYGDVGLRTQSSKVVDVTPLAQYSSRLDVIRLDAAVSLADTVDTPIIYQGPYPSFWRPSQEMCSEVCHRLWQLHGPLEEYAKHRVARISDTQVLSLEYGKEEDSGMAKDVLDGPKSTESSEAVLSGHPKERRTVLDSLVGTILSQNTTDTNSRRAFASLKKSFPTWEEVYRADPKAVEDAIRCGGLAEIKTSRIMNILSILDQERGKLCLEYVRDLSVDEVKLELSRFKGVGPKTIACVLMFHLQQNEFPVDTHVFRITKMLGWVPAKADREKAYLHLNHRIPDNLKFDLHCLLVTHGKRCPRCAKGGRTQKPADGPCPLANLSSQFIEASPCDLLMEP